MKIRLGIILISLIGVCLPAHAERNPKNHFSYFSFEHIQYREDSPGPLGQLEGGGPSLTFAKNFGRFFHVRGGLTSIGYDNIDFDKKLAELGIGASLISTEGHDLYLAATVIREQLSGTISNNSGSYSFNPNTNYLSALLGYRYYIRPGIQTIFEFKGSLPDADGTDNNDLNSRVVLGLRLHPPTNDRLSFGVRLGFDNLKYNYSSEEVNAKDTQLFLRVDY